MPKFASFIMNGEIINKRELNINIWLKAEDLSD